MPRVVFDSDQGRICPGCDRPIDRCACQAERPAGDGVVRLRREVRRGKPVTVVFGLAMTDAELKPLAKALKRRCSTGGSAKAGTIELQGDHRDVVETELARRGIEVVRAGG